MVASKARLRSDIGLAVNENRLSVAFATGPNDAIAMDLDPSSGGPTRRFSRSSPVPIRQVVPVIGNGGDLDVAIGIERLPNHLENALTVPTVPPFLIGTSNGNFGWAPDATGESKQLWRLPQGALHDLQAIELRNGMGFAIIFRLGPGLWFGRMGLAKEPVTPLFKIAERAGMRWPTFAESGGAVLFAWAEIREEERWSLGGASLELGDALGPIEVKLPTEAVAGDQILPALGALDGRRFVLVWTEGVAAVHRVRATTLDARGVPVGPALVVSSSEDAGWGRAAVTADGRGAVVYLAPHRGGMAAFATPIACPPLPNVRATRNAVLRAGG